MDIMNVIVITILCVVCLRLWNIKFTTKEFSDMDYDLTMRDEISSVRDLKCKSNDTIRVRIFHRGNGYYYILLNQYLYTDSFLPFFRKFLLPCGSSG